MSTDPIGGMVLAAVDGAAGGAEGVAASIGTLEPAEADEWIEWAIDVLARLRSDDRPDLIVTTGGEAGAWVDPDHGDTIDRVYMACELQQSWRYELARVPTPAGLSGVAADVADQVSGSLVPDRGDVER